MKKLDIKTKHPKNIRPIMTVVVIVAAVGVVGGIVWAKGNPNQPLVYLSPASGNFATGSNITVAVRENSNSTPVSAVQAGFTYPANLVQFVSVDGTGSAFSTDFTPGTQTPGQILITRSSLGTPATGDQLVANVNFQVLAAGKAALTLTGICQSTTAAANCTALSSAGNVIPSNTAGANYRLK